MKEEWKGQRSYKDWKIPYWTRKETPYSSRTIILLWSRQEGGFSQEALELLSRIWSFDYMGNAHFEFGDAPKSMHKIADYSSKKKAKTGFVSFGNTSSDLIYYICESGTEKEVEALIKDIYDDEWVIGLYERAYLRQSLHPSSAQEEFAQKYQGWLELNNGFMFFKNSEMYTKVAKLFQIPQRDIVDTLSASKKIA